jgi:hypothetical protein
MTGVALSRARQEPAAMRDFPVIVLLVSAAGLWIATWVGASVFGRRRALDEQSRSDYTNIAGAILTLLGLIIGFTFSMAVSRYDLRKTYEEAEANAIGTEFVRTDLLPGPDAARVRVLLTRYVDLRIRDYEARDKAESQQLKDQTEQLQAQLWSAVRNPATAQPSPLTALAVGGMNDVLNAQGYTQAAWWNRIPRSAWWLMAAIAVVSCTLVGYGAQAFKAEAYFIWVLPMVISIAFFLIADIDSPRGGLVRVAPQDLLDVARSMHASIAAHPA